MKRCGKCQVFLDLDKFYKNSKKKDGLSEWCKSCHKVYNKARYVYDAEATRQKHLQRAYKLTKEQYQELFDLQEGKCASCGNPETAIDPRTKVTANLSVDHCHTTNEVRGLLCQRCNIALGMLLDDPQRVRQLLTYIEDRSERIKAS